MLEVAERLHIIMNTFCHNILKSKMTRREKRDMLAPVSCVDTQDVCMFTVCGGAVTSQC